jgi:hypothetical protein
MNLEEALRHELSKALVQRERAKNAFAVQGAAAQTGYTEARGYCRGIARALELLEVRVDA